MRTAIIGLLQSGKMSAASAKQVLEETFKTGRDPADIVQEKGLLQITAGDEIAAAIERVLTEQAKAAEDYRRGKEGALQFLVGQVMRETRGRANPALVNQLLVEKLDAGA